MSALIAKLLMPCTFSVTVLNLGAHAPQSAIIYHRGGLAEQLWGDKHGFPLHLHR